MTQSKRKQRAILTKLQVFLTITKQTFKEWYADGAPTLGAALAYYAVFSLSPILVIVVAILSLGLGDKSSEVLIAQFSGLVGKDSAEVMTQVLKSANNEERGVFASIISAVMLFVGASGAFSQLQSALNTIWNVEVKPSQGIWTFIGQRFLSFGMVLAIGFLLLGSLVISAGISFLQTFIGSYFGAELLTRLSETTLSLGILTILFAIMFKFLPDIQIAWKDVWVGAFVTSILFTIGKYMIGLYLGRSSVASAYGAAGSLVVILLWMYYSSQIFLFGAEFTQVYSTTLGKAAVPSKIAQPRQSSTNKMNQKISS